MEATQIKELWNQVFPSSKCSVSKGALAGNNIYITGYLQQPEEWSNAISHNDPLSYMAEYNQLNNTYREINLSLTVKATNTHMAFGSVKINKKTIKNVTPEKLLKRFNEVKYFVKANTGSMVHDISGKV